MIAALDLRFRDGDDGDSPPDIDAFAPRRVARAAAAEPIGVVGDARGHMPGAPVHVFFQHAGYGIPALHTGEQPLVLSSWSLRPTAFGWLAQVEPSSTRAPQRTAWVLGAFLPLVMVTEAAAAAAPTSVQRPKKAVTKPEPPPLPDPPPETTPEDEVVEPPVAEPETTPDPPPTSDPFTGPSAPVQLDERAIRDAAWEGVDGFDVEVTLKGGGKMSGRVGAVQRDTFTLIQDETGAVLVMSKSGVRSLRVRVSKPLPIRTGTGALVGGGILTAVGTPVFISGLVFVAVCGSCISLHLPMLMIGGAALGGGIPLIVRGSRLRDKYRNALLQRGLSAYLMPSRQGWGGGLRFRF